MQEVRIDNDRAGPNGHAILVSASSGSPAQPLGDLIDGILWPMASSQLARYGSAFLRNPSSLEVDPSDTSVLITNHDFTPPNDPTARAQPIIVRTFVGGVESPRAHRSIR